MTHLSKTEFVRCVIIQSNRGGGASMLHCTRFQRERDKYLNPELINIPPQYRTFKILLNSKNDIVLKKLSQFSAAIMNTYKVNQVTPTHFTAIVYYTVLVQCLNPDSA